MLVHEKQSVTRTARGASPSGSSFPSSSSRGRKEEENETARKSRRMSSWFLMEGGRGGAEGRSNREDPATAAATTTRRRCNLLSSYPQPFSIQIEAAKKAQGTHTCTCVRRIYISARTHTRMRVGPPALCASLRITFPFSLPRPRSPPLSSLGLLLVFVHVARKSADSIGA